MSPERRHSPVNLRDAIAFQPELNKPLSIERRSVRFRGLFVGIDRHASPKISWLSCAKRDATALYALFCDTLGGEAELLVDQEATCQAIQECLANLATCDEEDVVVIAFSGHGTNSHQLVAHDTDTYNLDSTSISLEWFAELIARIPARRLICFLDCCFSGGVEAKVFQVEAVARNLESIDAALAQLSGKGRIILTASGPTEPAYESMRLGHGLLTYHLLEALQGVEEVQQSGKLAIYPLLQYITQRVIDASTQINKPQNPTLRGQIDGELLLPIFKPGTLYRAAFPERSHPEVTAEIQSLAPYGFPEALLQTWATVIPSFNALQLAAINEFKVLEGEHLVVSAPTSSGKTTVGELAALKSVLERKRALFLLPLKALVGDKFRTFNESYGSFGIITIQATGETDDITPLIRGQYDICLLTYEKFAAVVLTNPHILDRVGTVVIDEVQMIADETRGVNLEFILTLLRMRRWQSRLTGSLQDSMMVNKLVTHFCQPALAGRAGRLQLAERGTSYLLASDLRQAYDLWTQYVKGQPESLVSRFLSTDTDPRSLILRTLAATQKLSKPKAAQQLPRQGMQAEDLIEFLESSFGAFQQMQSAQQWKWNKSQLLAALQSLLQHRLVESDENDFYHLTPLGQLAGEVGVEVESIIRLVACFTSLNPESIREPTLLFATQLTVELERIGFPINWKSTSKEPTTWKQELLRQGVPHLLLNALDYQVTSKHQSILRAKKAVACLLFVTHQSMAEIEGNLTQFRGTLDGAAGAIRDVAERTCDLLPTVAQVAGMLHPSLDLEECISRLLIRLSVGVPSAAIDLARQVGTRLTRGEYLQLLDAGLCSIDQIEAASDSDLLPHLNHDQEKLALIRRTVEFYRQQELESMPSSPILEPFES